MASYISPSRRGECSRCGKTVQLTRTSSPVPVCLPCRRADPAPGTLRTRQKRQEILTVVCALCGESETYPWSPMRRKWCTDCRAKGLVINGQVKRQARARQSLDCARCSVSFIPGRSTQVYCSDTYRHAEPAIWTMGWCPRCGDAFTSRSIGSPRYCSQRCMRADHSARRDAIKRGAFVANVSRALIFERDKWRCQLCRKMVNRDAVVPHPKAPTLDHILPLSQGGTHEPANAQLACFLCNSMKSDGLYLGRPEQLSMVG